MRDDSPRYSSVAIVLHWVMAVAFVLMLGSGVVMSNVELSKTLQFNLYQWHKSLGVLLLVTAVLRLVWRLLHRPPALPVRMKRLERRAAKIGHWVLYGLMIALPLSGWVMVSSSVYGLPTIVFGWFEWPHVPAVVGNEMVNNMASEVHWIVALLFAIAIAGHVVAVIKHAVRDKEHLLRRMWWVKAHSLKSVLLVGLMLGFGSMAEAASYVVDPTTSEVRFSGEHAGDAFEGRFATWSAEIVFDAEDLAASHITARFDMASAVTGNKLYDGTLPQADWFDVQNHAEASFVSTMVSAKPEGGYAAAGELTIRGITQPVTFDFTIEQNAQPVIAEGYFVIDRLAYAIGKGSDPDAEWVSQEIAVHLHIEATVQ